MGPCKVMDFNFLCFILISVICYFYGLIFFILIALIMILRVVITHVQNNAMIEAKRLTVTVLWLLKSWKNNNYMESNT